MGVNLPLVSIGVPSYNCGEYIISTLESVKNQTYLNIELIIAEDCSTDDSNEKIKAWISESGFKNVQFTQNESNQGVAKTCGLLLDNFKGKYYAILGADDILMPDKIEKQVTLFETLDNSIALIYSDVKVVDEKGVIIGESYFDRIGYPNPSSELAFISLLQKNFIPALSVLIRTAAAKEVGGYDKSLFYEDWDMWLKLSKKYGVKYMNTHTGFYRIHQRSMMQDSTNIQKLNHSYIRMYKKYLGSNQTTNKIIHSRIKEISIYSYYKSDPEALANLWWSLKKNFSFKILIYYLLASLGIRLKFRVSKSIKHVSKPIVLILFFKVYHRFAFFFSRLDKRTKILKWRSLYRNRVTINSNFTFGKSCSFIFDASDSTIQIGSKVQVRDLFQIRSGNNGEVAIGDNVFFNNGCSLHCLSAIKIGNNNQFGEGVKMYDHNHRFREAGKLINEQGYSFGAIKIGNNCLFGSNVIILKGVEIGDNVVIGAGCLIYKSVASGSIVVNKQSLDVSNTGTNDEGTPGAESFFTGYNGRHRSLYLGVE